MQMVKRMMGRQSFRNNLRRSPRNQGRSTMGAPARDPHLSLKDHSIHEPPADTHMASTGGRDPIEGFSIVIGGPVYDFLLRIGLVRFDLPNILRRIAVVVALTWLPLLLLSLKDGLAFGTKVQIPLLY